MLCRREETLLNCVENLRASNLILCDRPRSWLLRTIQSAAWWICVRLGTAFHRPFTRSEYRTVRVEGASLLEKVRLNQHDLRMLWDQDGKYLIVGRKAAYDLLHECDDFMHFQVDVKLGLNRKTRVLGLEVVVVPWIEGLFVLPDLTK